MHRTRHRLAAGFTATLAGLTLAAAPALAGEDDDGDDEDARVESPSAPAPVPVERAGGPGELSGAPVGGVATGAGGTAPQGPDAVLLGLGSGALLLVATGGRLMLAARRTQA